VQGDPRGVVGHEDKWSVRKDRWRGAPRQSETARLTSSLDAKSGGLFDCER
jgi:hypothetical protein